MFGDDICYRVQALPEDLGVEGGDVGAVDIEILDPPGVVGVEGGEVLWVGPTLSLKPPHK